MNITNQQLRRIIKEELRQVLVERMARANKILSAAKKIDRSIKLANWQSGPYVLHKNNVPVLLYLPNWNPQAQEKTGFDEGFHYVESELPGIGKVLETYARNTDSTEIELEQLRGWLEELEEMKLTPKASQFL